MKTLLVSIFVTLAICSSAQINYPQIQSNPGVVDPISNYVITKGKLEDLCNISPSNRKTLSRWDYFWRGRNSMIGVQVGGDLNVGQLFSENLINNQIELCRYQNPISNWKLLGPKSSEYSDMGVVFTVAAHPSNLNIIYCGTVSSGLWKSVDGGNNWNCMTDNIKYPSLGVSGIIINPDNSQNIIFSSGGRIHGTKSSYGAGIFESKDGGLTWTQIYAPPFTQTYQYNDYFISSIKFNPSNSNTIYAISLDKVIVLKRSSYSSGWNPFVSTQSFFGGLSNSDVGSWKNFLLSMVVKNNSNSTTLFVSSFVKNALKFESENPLPNLHAVIWKSTDEGITWTSIPLPKIGQEIDDNCAFISLSNSQSSLGVLYAHKMQWQGKELSSQSYLYKSLDDGATWNLLHQLNTSPSNGNHQFKVSDYNSDIAFVGEGKLYKITGLNSNNPISEVVTQYGPDDPNTHADIRDVLEFHSGDNHIMLIAHDGGVSIATTSFGSPNSWGKGTWLNKNGTGLAISQFSGFDYFPSSGFVVGGKQDNATQIQVSENAWKQIAGGDGNMIRINKYDESCFIGGVNASELIKFSNDANFSYSTITLPDHKYFQFWPQKVDPTDQSIFWLGQTNVYKFNSLTNILTPSTVVPIPGIKQVGAFAINPENNNIRVASNVEPTWGSLSINHGILFKTTDGGINWVDITENFKIISNTNSEPIYLWSVPNDIIFSPHNGQRIFVGMNGYLTPNGNNNVGRLRVVCSNDGGSTWQDMSEGLPPFPVNKLAYQEGTDDVIYAATDVGVYVWNKTNQVWYCFNTGMPPAIVNDLQIDYCRNKLLCSTWGRGLWESPLPDIINPFEIKSNFVWGPKSYHAFMTDLVIPNGVTLTVKGKVCMAKGKSITIKCGGKLILDGGVITNQCNEYWEGVLVEGNKNLDQLPTSNQGYFLSINNAIISNAKNAVVTYTLMPNGQYNWPASGGGIIISTNTKFINNKRHIAFMSYHRNGNLNDLSTFKNCTFETNSTYNPTINTTEAPINMVTAWDVKGVKFNGCQFINKNGALNAELENTDRGTGILSYDAALIVDGIMNDITCVNEKTGNFYNLSTGIHSFSSAYLPFAGEYKKQQFQLTDRGILAECSGVLSLHHNSFNLFVPDNYYNRLHSRSNSDLARKNGVVGIYTNGSSGYKIEQNSFMVTALPNIPFTSIQPNEFLGGMVLNNGDINGGTGDCRLNSFLNLNIGTQLQQDNTSLKITCNQFSTNRYALRLNPELNGSTPFFGACNAQFQYLSVDYQNEFQTSSFLDIENKPNLITNVQNTKTYVIKLNASNRPSQATVNSNVNVDRCPGIPVGSADDCLPIPQFADKCLFTESDFPQPNYAKYVLGKTNLATTIQTINTEGMTDNLLMQKSFYEREIAQTRSDIFWSHSWSALINDSTNYYQQTINFLEQDNQAESKLFLVAAYYYTKQYQQASNILNTISKTESANTNAFKSFYNLLISVAIEGRNIFQLTPTEIQTLIELTTTNTNAGISAQGILTLCYNQKFDVYIEKPDEINSLGKKSDNKVNTNASVILNSYNTLITYPNPTKNLVTINYTLTAMPQNAQIVICDVLGRVVSVRSINQIQSSLTINLDNISSGTYYVKLLNHNQVLQVQKLIKQ